MINKLIAVGIELIARLGFTRAITYAFAFATAMGVVTGLILRAVIYGQWLPIAVLSVVGLVAYVVYRGRRVKAEQRLHDAELEKEIGSSLTDESLRWAVQKWKKQYF